MLHMATLMRLKSAAESSPRRDDVMTICYLMPKQPMPKPSYQPIEIIARDDRPYHHSICFSGLQPGGIIIYYDIGGIIGGGVLLLLPTAQR